MAQDVVAPIKSSFSSSINWAQVLMFGASALAWFGYKVPPELIGTITGAIPTVLAAVGAVVSVFTIIKRTWFTTSITTASATNMRKA